MYLENWSLTFNSSSVSWNLLNWLSKLLFISSFNAPILVSAADKAFCNVIVLPSLPCSIATLSSLVLNSSERASLLLLILKALPFSLTLYPLINCLPASFSCCASLFILENSVAISLTTISIAVSVILTSPFTVSTALMTGSPSMSPVLEASITLTRTGAIPTSLPSASSTLSTLLLFILKNAV